MAALLLNIPLILVTLDVSKLLKSRVVALLPANISLISVTLLVLKLLKSIVVALLLKNIPFIFVTLLVSKLHKSKFNTGSVSDASNIILILTTLSVL